MEIEYTQQRPTNIFSYSYRISSRNTLIRRGHFKTKLPFVGGKHGSGGEQERAENIFLKFLKFVKKCLQKVSNQKQNLTIAWRVLTRRYEVEFLS